MSHQEAPQDVEPVTQADLDSFAQKLEWWGESLPPSERALLRVLLAQTSNTPTDEVQGYFMNSTGLPTAHLIHAHLSPAVSRGIGISAADTGSWLNLGWQQASMPQANVRV